MHAYVIGVMGAAVLVGVFWNLEGDEGPSVSEIVFVCFAWPLTVAILLGVALRTMWDRWRK